MSAEIQKIVVASKSKIKLDVVISVLSKLIPNLQTEVIGIDLESDGAEPVGEKAILSQITEAIRKARKLHPDAEFYCGMEGGVEEKDHGMEEAAYVVIENKNGSNRSISRSVSFPIPPAVAKLVRNGIPFGDAVDKTYSTKNIKTGQGFVGLLTNGMVDKKALYIQPTAVAFSKFLKEAWFEDLEG